MKANKDAIHSSLVPQQEVLLKDLNQLVDKQLQQVVEKINVKKELEKKKRELLQKLQKRHDELQSLEH